MTHGFVFFVCQFRSLTSNLPRPDPCDKECTFAATPDCPRTRTNRSAAVATTPKNGLLSTDPSKRPLQRIRVKSLLSKGCPNMGCPNMGCQRVSCFHMSLEEIQSTLHDPTFSGDLYSTAWPFARMCHSLRVGVALRVGSCWVPSLVFVRLRDQTFF